MCLTQKMISYVFNSKDDVFNSKDDGEKLFPYVYKKKKLKKFEIAIFFLSFIYKRYVQRKKVNKSHTTRTNTRF